MVAFRSPGLLLALLAHDPAMELTDRERELLEGDKPGGETADEPRPDRERNGS
jgi:hypothetical protein